MSEKGAHRPGPWTVNLSTLVYGTRVSGVDDEELEYFPVCDTSDHGGPTDFDAANARLIAAAPDLMTALQAMTDATEMLGPPNLRAARDLAFRAISKAKEPARA